MFKLVTFIASLTLASAFSPVAKRVNRISSLNADIVDTAVSAGNFKTLAAALGAANLVTTLKGPGPFTVFAPTDAAFAKLPPGTVEGLLKDIPKLSSILTYHVVPGSVMAETVVTLNNKMVKTVNGAEVKVTVGQDGVTLDGSSKVVTTDIKCDNGKNYYTLVDMIFLSLRFSFL